MTGLDSDRKRNCGDMITDVEKFSENELLWLLPKEKRQLRAVPAEAGALLLGDFFDEGQRARPLVLPASR